jgi:hypothetical protein
MAVKETKSIATKRIRKQMIVPGMEKQSTKVETE